MIQQAAARAPERGRRRWRRSRLVAAAVLLAVIAVAAGILVGRGRQGSPGNGRPDLQRILDALVAGPAKVAPGVTAYVAGPAGSWQGAAGLADVVSGQPMWPAARMHLDSLSKAWTATLLLQLAAKGRLHLDDTVARWLPGVLPFGSKITIRELLNHTSGLIDTNDFTARPARYLERIHDGSLRAHAFTILRRVQADPSYQFSTWLWIRLAAHLPLRSQPGTTYRYSNIGYDIAGLIAAKAAGHSLATLYLQQIARPLGLATVSYTPQGLIAGPHVHEYVVRRYGHLTDATGWYRGGMGAAGGLVANAGAEARFLTALMRGTLLPAAELEAMKTVPPNGANYALGLGRTTLACGSRVYHVFSHLGSNYQTMSIEYVSGDGSRVVVILANARDLTAAGRPDRGLDALVAAAGRLFCAR